MPMTRGSTPATALPAKAASGSTPSARARSSLAITSAAAPSLMPLELPAVTLPPARNAGRSFASASAVESGRGCSSTVDVADRDQLVREAPGRLRLGPALLRAQRERVLILAADAVALGHVLAGLAHALEREHRLHGRIGEAPAERACRRARGRRAGMRARAWPSRAARGSSTRRRRPRRGRRRPRARRGRRPRPPRARTRRAG